VPTVTEPKLLETQGHGEIFKGFVTSILTGAPMSPSGEEGLERVRLIEAIYRSAELGREVDVDEGPGPR
jgi:predicted dehydrogenase